MKNAVLRETKALWNGFVEKISKDTQNRVNGRSRVKMFSVIACESRQDVLAALILAGFCLLGYANSLTNRFMLDDYLVLFGQTGVAHKSFVSLLTNHQFAFYRPLGHVFLMVSHRLFAENYVAYHLANLLLLFLICWLFYRITDKLFGDKNLALLTALLYGVHPINGMLVNYITASVISTFVMALQVSLLLFLKFLDKRHRPFYVLSIFSFVVGLLSHECSLVFPFYVVCVLVFLRRLCWKEVILLIWPYVLTAALYIFFRFFFFSLKGVLDGARSILPDMGVFISVVGDFLYWYAAKLLWPQDIVFLWTGFVFNEFLMVKIGKAVLLFLGIGYLIFWRWKNGLKAFALAFFTAGILPMTIACFGYCPDNKPFFEPHWFYFSSFGLFLLASYGLLAVRRYIRRPLWTALCVGIIVSFVMALWQNNRLWKDQESYCRHWLEVNPQNQTPFQGLGEVLLQRGDFSGAIHYLRKGLSVVKFGNFLVFRDLGYAYSLSGDRDNALRYYFIALKFNPNHAKTHYYLGLLYWREKRLEEAEMAFAAASRLDPQNEMYRQYLGAVRAMRKKEGNYSTHPEIPKRDEEFTSQTLRSPI